MTEGGIAGAYFDGRSARRVAVTITFGADGLALAGPEDGTPLPGWPYPDLRLASVPGKAQVLLRNTARPEERLGSDDPTLLRQLETRAPQLYKASAFRRDNWRVAGLCVLVGAAFVGVLLGFNALAEPIAARLPLAWERPLGVKVVEAVAPGRRVCSDPDGVAALGRLTARLVAAGKLPAKDIEVRVADDARVNAFAAPGGEIVILRGLLDGAESADEVAGVMAHEIGHVIHRDPTKMLVRVLGAEFLLQMISGNAASIGSMALVLSYSREAEAAADRAGVALLHEAGIGTQGLADFFTRIAAKEGPGSPVASFLATHPATGDRIAALKAAEELAVSTSALGPKDWGALKGICRLPPVKKS